MVDVKNVKSADGDTSQDERKSAVNEFSAGEPSPPFIGKVGDTHDNEIVDPLQDVEYYDESSSEISEKKGEVTLKVKPLSRNLQLRKKFMKQIVIL